MTALMSAALYGSIPCALALIEAKANLNATAVIYFRLCTRSATLKSVQLIQTTQTRSKTPSYVVAFACELVALVCLRIIELCLYLLVRIVGWIATWSHSCVPRPLQKVSKGSLTVISSGRVLYWAQQIVRVYSGCYWSL
jgi:hypothetical protein